ncbi:MAG TPA: hypothetical protein VK572_15165 [Burkholderiales bacterium]|nr:hypothetical protein [Burkholderiales bacterium]
MREQQLHRLDARAGQPGRAPRAPAAPGGLCGFESVPQQREDSFFDFEKIWLGRAQLLSQPLHSLERPRRDGTEGAGEGRFVAVTRRVRFSLERLQEALGGKIERGAVGTSGSRMADQIRFVVVEKQGVVRVRHDDLVTDSLDVDPPAREDELVRVALFLAVASTANVANYSPRAAVQLCARRDMHAATVPALAIGDRPMVFEFRDAAQRF